MVGVVRPVFPGACVVRIVSTISTWRTPQYLRVPEHHQSPSDPRHELDARGVPEVSWPTSIDLATQFTFDHAVAWALLLDAHVWVWHVREAAWGPP